MNEELEFIQAALQGLQSLPIEQIEKLSVSVERHKYRLNPPLNEEVVRQFEREHRIKLPSGYREFLIHLGNGGAGPAYGVFKLGEVVIGWDSKPFSEFEGLVGDLSKPFPHVEAWNDPSDEAIYWAPVDGAIPLSDIGCNLRFWLVISGVEAGNVWRDERADYAGFSPTRMTFIQWYRKWLDDELARHLNGPIPTEPG